MISETGRILRAGDTPAELGYGMAKARREHQCQKALDKLEIAIRHVKRLGYYSLAEDVEKSRDILRTLTRAENMR